MKFGTIAGIIGLCVVIYVWVRILYLDYQMQKDLKLYYKSKERKL